MELAEVELFNLEGIVDMLLARKQLSQGQKGGGEGVMGYGGWTWGAVTPLRRIPAPHC